jgi:hypothetical protein
MRSFALLYLQNNRLREAEVCERLAVFFMSKADPTKDGTYGGESLRYMEDLGEANIPASTVVRDECTAGCYSMIHVHFFPSARVRLLFSSVLPPSGAQDRRDETDSGVSHLHRTARAARGWADGVAAARLPYGGT